MQKKKHGYAPLFRPAFTLIVVLLLAAVGALAQDKQELISIKFSPGPLPHAIKALQGKTSRQIAYDEQQLKTVTIKEQEFTEQSLRKILAQLLQGTGFDFQEISGNIVIVKKQVIKKPVVVTRVIRDGKTRQDLAGVTVVVEGIAMATTTDEEGRFTITVKDSTELLTLSYTGYASRSIRVSKLPIVILMEPDARTLGGVVVSARRRVATEAALLTERKNAAIVSDGISAQHMERTASITTTQALQRVSGVTVTDDKYVAIRGLGDRSVIGQMNGIRLASSDPDRTTLPLDLIPSSLLDNITVYKSMSPDKPADAAAGIVELKTKSIPEKKTLSITIQSGMNTQTGNRVNSFYNSDMGFFGGKVNKKALSRDFLALAEQYPNGLGQMQQQISDSRNDPALLTEANRINGIMRQFDPVLTTRYKTAPVNQSYSVTYGDSYTLFGKHQLGLILGGNYYNRTKDIYGGQLTQWSLYQGALTGNRAIDNPRVIPNYVTPNNINLGKYLNYTENTGTQTLNYGYLGGLVYRFSPQHEISFQYLGSRGAETQATNLSGAYEYIALPGGVANTVYSLKQTYRTLNTFNLQAEHKFMPGEYSPRLSYNLANSTSSQEDPDFRFVNLADYMPRDGAVYEIPSQYQNGTVNMPTDHLYSLISGYVNGYGPYGIIQADPNGRRFRKLKEENYNYKADLSLPFRLFGQKQEFRTGVNYLHRRRSFGENVLYLPGSNFSNAGALPLYQVNGDLDQLVSHNRIGIHPFTGSTGEGQPRIGGYIYNSQKSPNNYTGYFETRAFYGMLDLRITEQLRLTGGARWEMTDIQAIVDTANVYLDPSISTTDASGNKVNLVYTEPGSAYKQDYTPFYSANLTYTLNKNMNFRLGYNNSLARPELRELTNVFDFDPFQFALVVGNPDLVNQRTTNYDFRWEWFPATGEVISGSVFYKQIDNQLTKVFKQNSEGLDARFPEFPAIEFQNDPNRGHVYGIELELVKNLAFLWKPLNHFFLGSNLLLAQSDIKKTPERLESSRAIDRRSPSNSPLFEQAPYSVNVYLNYANRKTGSDFTATFNMVGERLIQVNLDGTPDLYTRPMPILDFVFTQQLYKRLQAKGFAKNILDHPYQEVYANPGTGGKFYGTEYLRRSYRRGTEIMIGLSYTL
ncbi:MAG: TonB-dependent receptor [Candidatus Pseudobacter hemicellulosilyticus]|uniref:TonB-dependent receptor n=1 Tax=Candidatus Pseudobacter hemicellulosilyticus TaxID=3121375 RepID=A0AAJ6BH45_9BACT|nr:MAG: TonB-dependent receptor [Pseudobacter sp.]